MKRGLPVLLAFSSLAAAKSESGVVPGLFYSRRGLGGEVSFVSIQGVRGLGFAFGGENDPEGVQYLEFEGLLIGDVHGTPLLGACLGAGPMLSGKDFRGWQATASAWAALPIFPYFRYQRDLVEGPHTELGAMLKVPLGNFD